MAAACVLAAGLLILPKTAGWPSASCSANAQTCGGCPDYCNGEDPCPPEPEMPAVSCPITGPTDYCTYPGTGCPVGEDVSQYGNCCYIFNSPIIIDLANDGFDLTNLASGVVFSIGPSPLAYQVSWTYPGSDDAWLALDRDNNGTIDSGLELFGNFTAQPNSARRRRTNGFLALGEFDKTAEGGNADGQIDRSDAIFGRLRLWQDLNHNGVSEAHEMFELVSQDIASLDLNYKDWKYTDEFGNLFRYRAKVRTTREGDAGKWAYDVFLRSKRF